MPSLFPVQSLYILWKSSLDLEKPDNKLEVDTLVRNIFSLTPMFCTVFSLAHPSQPPSRYSAQ